MKNVGAQLFSDDKEIKEEVTTKLRQKL